MPVFACPACQKKLSVKEELEGKKVRCPGCGQVLAVPAPVSVGDATEGAHPVPSPAPGPDEAVPPTQASLPQPRETPTQSSALEPDATLDGAGGGPDPSLTDFLAPRQGDDELGRLGQYRVLKVLGHGGMGVVYQAEDPKLRRSVAIKAMLPALAASASAGQRFLREAQAMAAVEHDHIVRVYQVDEERGVPFLVMELLRGEPLSERLKREECLPAAEVLRIGREVALALAAAHATGLIHRDVKPANIWLEPSGRVKILDFGLARAASQEAGLTQSGAIVGTPAYMAPEQARGEKVDARTDLFSLGCVLYRMLTGQQPFRGSDSLSTLVAVATQQPPAPVEVNPGVPPELSELVMRLLEKDPARRPASAGEVAGILRTLQGKLVPREESPDETLALPPAAGVKKAEAAPRARRRTPLVIAALLLLAGLVGLGALALIRIQTEQGDYVIDTDDPDFSFRVVKGAVSLEDRKTGRKYDLKVVRQDSKAGEYELEVSDADGGLAFKTRTFTIRRGERVALKAWFERKKEVAAKGAVDDAWLKQTAALPAEEQVAAVSAKLRELNPGFDGKVEHKVEGGVVTELKLVTDHVTDVSPLRVFNALKVLDCSGTYNNYRGNGQLVDLSSLQGMSLGDLTYLNLSWTKVGDTGLGYFKSCKNLLQLHLDNTQVSDAGVAHFKSCKDLTHLSLGHTQVSDVGLTHFSGCEDLGHLNLSHTQVTDAGLAHFLKRRENLTHLYLGGTQVRDLSPLNDMKLTFLTCNKTLVTDLSPLQGMPLKALMCDFRPERDTEVLRSLETLETINGKPAADFWKEVEARQAAFQAWLKQTAALPAEQQVAAVAAKLRELNPGFDGKVEHKVEGGVVTELKLVTDQVTDVSPLRVFSTLKVLDLGGTATFDNGRYRGNGKLADLSPLQGMPLAGLTQLSLVHTKVSDADVALFKDCKSLTHLHLGGTQVSDAGLAHFKSCKGLKLLSLDNTRVSDAGLAHFKDCTELKILSLAWTQVSDAGLAPFKDCNNLTSLNLGGARVSDAGLAHFQGRKSLTSLGLHNTQVSDAGLAYFKDCKNLRELKVGGTQVSDLSPLRGMKLTVFSCNATRVTDLSPLRGMPLKELWCDFRPERDTEVLRSLKTLETINGKPAADFWKEVEQAQVRKAAFEAWLKQTAALPAEEQMAAVAAKLRELNPGFDGKVEHKVEGGVVTELRLVTDHVTDVSPLRVFSTLKVLDLGGTATFDNGHYRGNGKLADLSSLQGMSLAGLTQLNLNWTKVGDTSLVVFKDCKGLTQLSLVDTQASDAGLVHFKSCKGLKALHLSHTLVSDAGIASFAGCKDLRYLSVRSTQVGDAGLANFRDCNGLTTLDLSYTQVSDAGLAHFKGCKDLKELSLSHTNVSDAGLAHFRDCKNLEMLWIPATKAGDAGLAHFKGCSGLLYLGLHNTQVSDAGLTHLQDCKKLKRLLLYGTKVSDLSSLKGLKLTALHCQGTKVTDLSPLRGMPLKDLGCDFSPDRDTELLRSFKTLETINDEPAADFWKEVEQAQVRKTAFEAWLKQTAALPAEEQVAAVAAKLRELNAGFDGKLTHKVEGGVVTELKVVTDQVTDVSPLRALAGLRSLSCGGASKDRRRLSDLSPLKGLKLTSLDCSLTLVSDLSPLVGMPLTRVVCHHTLVADLKPLQGMGLTELICGDTMVADLSPLRGMKLESLSCRNTEVADLTPLTGLPLTYLDCDLTRVADLAPVKDMPLTYVSCGATRVSDLSPLRGLKLTFLNCGFSQVSDLSPLQGMELTVLRCPNTKVTDLSPVREMPLKEIECDYKSGRDTEVLRSFKTLEKINRKPAADFWKEVAAQKP